MVWIVTTANSPLEFDTQNGLSNNCTSIDANHFLNFWRGGATSVGYVQVFTVDTTTWAVTTANASLNYDTQLALESSCAIVDTNHFINFWRGESSDGYVQIFEVNTTTWAVTTAAARLEFDTQDGKKNACAKIDANHFINFWQGLSDDGFVQVFEVNTTTWSVSTAAANLEFDTQNNFSNFCMKVDTNHFINFWLGGLSATGYVQVFTVNTTTWAVTTANASLNYDTQRTNISDCCAQVDANHFINFWKGESDDGYVQVFTVNTTTWAVTTAAARLEFDATLGQDNSCAKISDNHFINFWAGSGTDGYAQVFEVNTTTWVVTTISDPLEYDTQNNQNNSCFRIDTNHFINFWAGSGTDGYVQTFTAAESLTTIKSYNTAATATVKTVLNGTAIANRKTWDGIV